VASRVRFFSLKRRANTEANVWQALQPGRFGDRGQRQSLAVGARLVSRAQMCSTAKSNGLSRTRFGPRLSNALAAQVDDHLSRRTFFTLVGNYEILHFYNSGLATTPSTNVQTGGFKLIDSSAAGFQTGIGYERSRRDTFAVVYRFNDLWFGGAPVSVRDNTLQGAYQRQVGQCLLLQLGAGPEFSFIHDPNSAGTTLASYTRVSWTVNGLVHYQLSRVLGVSAGYDHFLSSGSGVFLGAITDHVFAGLNRQLSRAWTLDMSASYAHNGNLVPLFNAATLVEPANATYDSIYGALNCTGVLAETPTYFSGIWGAIRLPIG
jgi:hypothetical protein